MSLRNLLVFLIGLTFASQFALGQERLKKLNIKTYGDGSFFVTSFVENVLFQAGEIKADQYGEFRRAIVDNDIKIVDMTNRLAVDDNGHSWIKMFVVNVVMEWNVMR